jgi:hypothetical protein
MEEYELTPRDEFFETVGYLRRQIEALSILGKHTKKTSVETMEANLKHYLITAIITEYAEPIFNKGKSPWQEFHKEYNDWEFRKDAFEKFNERIKTVESYHNINWNQEPIKRSSFRYEPGDTPINESKTLIARLKSMFG